MLVIKETNLLYTFEDPFEGHLDLSQRVRYYIGTYHPNGSRKRRKKCPT